MARFREERVVSADFVVGGGEEGAADGVEVCWGVLALEPGDVLAAGADGGMGV